MIVSGTAPRRRGRFGYGADLEVLDTERQPEWYLGRMIGFIEGRHEKDPRRRGRRRLDRRGHLVT